MHYILNLNVITIMMLLNSIPLFKQDGEAPSVADRSDATPPIGKILAINKITITFETI